MFWRGLYLKESQNRIESIIPKLNQIKGSQEDEIKVHVYKGIGGVRSAFNDVVRVGKPLYGFGLAGQMRKNTPIYSHQWLRDLRKKKIKSRHIYVEGIMKPADFGDFEVRYVPKDFYSPAVTFIYGDKVSISMWESSIVIIVIESKQIASNYKKYFNLLWKMAKK